MWDFAKFTTDKDSDRRWLSESFFAIFLQTQDTKSAEARFVRLENAVVHDHENSCFACLLRSFFVDDAFLHPDNGNLLLNGLVHDLFDKLRTAKYIDDVDLILDIEQAGAGLFSQRSLDLWVHGDDPIAMSLHVG